MPAGWDSPSPEDCTQYIPSSATNEFGPPAPSQLSAREKGQEGRRSSGTDSAIRTEFGGYEPSGGRYYPQSRMRDDASIAPPLQGGSLKPPTSSTLVADKLREEVVRGTLAPGTRLRQVQLARELGVSTTPVREAFQLLHSEGILESDPHRGVIVRRPSAAEVAENYEIRCELESLAAAWALPNLTDERIAEMEALQAEMDATLDERQYVELNYRFHDALYGASGRRKLCALIENLRALSSAYVYHHLYISHLDEASRAQYLQRLSAEHHEILASCRARDVDRLTSAIRQHVQKTAVTIVNSIS